MIPGGSVESGQAVWHPPNPLDPVTAWLNSVARLTAISPVEDHGDGQESERLRPGRRAVNRRDGATLSPWVSLRCRQRLGSPGAGLLVDGSRRRDFSPIVKDPATRDLCGASRIEANRDQPNSVRRRGPSPACAAPLALLGLLALCISTVAAGCGTGTLRIRNETEQGGAGPHRRLSGRTPRLRGRPFAPDRPASPHQPARCENPLPPALRSVPPNRHRSPSRWWPRAPRPGGPPGRPARPPALVVRSYPTRR
jgi:hypothetical protein